MDIDQSPSIAEAALAARDRLVAAGTPGGTAEHALAGVARAAVFEEALLAALRSRFNELRTVAK